MIFIKMLNTQQERELNSRAGFFSLLLGERVRVRASVNPTFIAFIFFGTLIHFLECQETLQLTKPRGMPHFPQGLGFDLPDPFAGDFKLAANFLQRAGRTIAKAKAQFQHLALPLCQTREHVAQLFFQQLKLVISEGHSVDLSSMKSPKLRVLAVADRAMEGDRLLRHLQHGADPLDRQLHLFGNFFRSRLTAEILDQALLHPHQLVDRLDHVHRNADRAGLVGDARVIAWRIHHVA